MDERENSPAVAASAPMAEAEQPTQQLQEEHVTENQQEPPQQAEVGNVTTAVRNVVIDDEDEDDSAYVDEGAGLPYSDHNYDTHDPSKRVKDSTVFPVIKGLSEYGIFTDEENPTAEHQHQPVLRTEKVYYDQQGMLHPARARTEGVVYRTSGGEGVGAPRKVLIGGNNYTFNPSSSSNYKSVSARSEYPAGSGSQQSYMVSSFGGRMQRIPGSALGMQGQVMQSNVTASRKPGRPPVKPATPPVRMMTQPPQQAPMAEPPHRALVVGKPIAAPPPPPTAAYQQPAAAQSDSMEHQLHPPRAAPLLVAGRGAKPVIRGRTGSTAIYRRKDETGDQMYDEVGNPISPRKMVNFVDGIPPGGASMSSAAGTVNLVVGAPPGGVSGAPHAHGAHPAPHGPHQEGDKEWEVNQAVLENVHAIHGKLETATGGQQKRETPQPLPVELRNAIMNGEASVRMLNFHTMVKCKHSLPDIPPDPPAAEPRPRGRPKGSTNRNRAASTSTSGAPTTASTAVLAATNGVPAALPAQSPALVTAEPLQSTPGAGVGSPRRSPSKASAGSPHRPPMGARSPQKAQQEHTEPASSPLMPQAVPPVVSVTAPPVMPADIDESVPAEEKKIETAKIETPEAPPPKARRSFAASPQRPNGVRSETSGADSMVSGGEEEEAESGAESDSSQTTEDEWGDYVTRCNCGMTHTDEHMIQCEKCDVWQHSKCMGLNIKKLPKVYLCEQCDPRPLKWNAEQARDYQERQLKLILKATEKRRAERRKRREEKRKAKERREKAKLKKAAAKAPSGSQYRKYNEIKENVYSKMARNLLALYGNTEKAPEVLACMTQVEPMFGRMFVAPGIEGIVAISDIAKHAIVMEYLGNVCLPAECQGREKMGQIQPYTILYSGLADQDSMLVIDARKLGSDSRFVRRSCRPNTVLRHVMLDGQIHVLLNATEPIEKSVEITIPFDTDFRECPRPLQCACGDEESCPIADFNSRLQKSPSPPKRKSQGSAPVSTPSSAASATTPGRKGATPKSAQTKSASKTANKKATPASNSSKRGRPPKIKLRRPERKTAKKAETTDDEGAEGPSESARKPRLAERTRTLSSAEEPKQEEEVKEEEELVSVKEEKDDRRVSRRLRRDTDTTVSAEKEKDVKEELEDGEIDDEDERQVPRKRTRSSTVQSTRKRGDSPKKRDDESVTRETRRKSSVVKDEKNKKEMDYTLPEDRQKMSREERKLQQQLALINKLEKEEAHKVHPKAGSPAKETKRGPKSPTKAERDASETRQRKTPKKRLLVDRIKQEERSPAPTRSSPRSPRKESLSEPKTELGGEPMEDDSEAQSRPIMAPPRRRWQQEQQMKEMEARNLPPDVHPSSGRKVWLLRRAQLDQRSEEPPPDPAPSVQRSPPRMQSPHRIESSLPPKKRRHLYSSSTPSTSDIDDALSRNEAAHLLTQMAATSSKSTSKEPEQSVRKMIRDLAYSIVRTTPAEEYSLPGPAKGSGGDESEWPSPSPAPQLKKKRVSLDEYKKRRDGGPAPGPAGSSTSTAENNKKKSFIPDMQVVQEDVRLGPLPNPKELGSPKEDLEELKRRIYGETSSPSSSKDVILPPPPPPAYPNTSGLTPPPPPPDLPPTSPAKSTTSARGSPQKRDGGESTDDDGPRHPRMSVADRLKGLFGGLIGTP